MSRSMHRRHQCRSRRLSRTIEPVNGAATGMSVWLTGLSGAGKTTTAVQVISDLRTDGVAAILLDGDELRDGVSDDLDFSAAGRAEAVRRAGEIALLVATQGFIAVVSMVSPHEGPRQLVRQRHLDAGIRFIEVHVATPLAVCEQRDPKHLYRQARESQERSMTGVYQPYEEPADPEIRFSTSATSTTDASALIVEHIRSSPSV